MSTRDEHKQWFDAKFPPESVSRDDEREYVLRRFYDNDVMVTMTFLDDGKTADLFIPASHRAAVAAALCPPAPGEVTVRLSREQAEAVMHFIALNHLETTEAGYMVSPDGTALAQAFQAALAAAVAPEQP